MAVLEVGNLWGALGDAEGRSHFAMWSVMKAPLLLGTDVTNMTSETLATLTNEDVIAVNQDRLGIQARLVPSANGSVIPTPIHRVADGSRVEETTLKAAAEWAWAVPATERSPDHGWALETNGIIKHAPDGLCLTAQAHGNHLQPLMLQGCAAPGTSAAILQAWELDINGNLRLKGGSKKCLALWGGNGPGVVIFDCNTGDNEVFSLSKGKKGSTLCAKRLSAPHETLCLTTNSTKPTKGGGGGGGSHPPPPSPSSVLTWVGELAGGAHVALLVNNMQGTTSLSFDTSNLRLSDTVSMGCFVVRELWTNRTLPQTVCAGTATELKFPDVGAHDCVMLRFSPEHIF